MGRPKAFPKQMARKISGRKASKKQSAAVKYDFCGCCPEGLVVYPESIEDVLDTDCHNAFRENFEMFLRKQKDKNTETDMDFEMKHQQRMNFAEYIGKGARCFKGEDAYENQEKRGSWYLAMAGRRFISRPYLSNYNWPDDMLEGFDEADVLITHLKDLDKSFGHKNDDLSNDDMKAIKKNLVVSGYRWVVEQLDAALEEFREFRDGLGENEREKWDKSVVLQSEKLIDFGMETFESYEEECERFEVVGALIKELHKEMDDIIARYNNRNKDIDSLVELIEGKSLGAVPKKKKENISRSHKKKNPEKKRKDAEDESEGNINSQQFDTSSLIALDTKFKLIEVEEEVSQNANSVPMMNEYPKVGSSEMQRLMATEVEEASSASPSTPRDPSNDLRPIQVPMPGPNGTQILQTINVPRSVLATASDKPILLTVTPKNDINKGMKQVLVLTKTQPGATKGGPPMFNFSLGQTSPGNVTLSPRSSMATTPPRLPTEPLPPSIKDLQHPLPRQPGTTTLEEEVEEADVKKVEEEFQLTNSPEILVFTDELELSEEEKSIRVKSNLTPKYLVLEHEKCQNVKEQKKVTIQESGDKKDALMNTVESIQKEPGTNHVFSSNVENREHQIDEVRKDDDVNGQILINEVKKEKKRDKASKPNCARDSCTNRGRHKCSRCKAVFYCAQDCLNEDWPLHKMFCDYVFKANQVPGDSTSTISSENSGGREEVD